MFASLMFAPVSQICERHLILPLVIRFIPFTQ
jgi:hypothetical protein